jgi:flagellar biosynthesis/type III secretory pathway protein FliH
MEVTNGLASYVMEKAAKEGYGQGYGKGYGQGYDRGSNETNRQNILRMHKKGMNTENIAMFLDLPLEKVTDIIQKK